MSICFLYDLPPCFWMVSNCQSIDRLTVIFNWNKLLIIIPCMAEWKVFRICKPMQWVAPRAGPSIFGAATPTNSLLACTVLTSDSYLIYIITPHPLPLYAHKIMHCDLKIILKHLALEHTLFFIKNLIKYYIF